MTWQQVTLVALNTVQVIALAALAMWERRTSREVRRINGDVEQALSAARGADGDANIRSRPHDS